METPCPEIEKLMVYKQEMDRLPALKRRSDHLRRQLQETGRLIDEQEKRLRSEQADVDQLGNKTLGNYILSLSRRMDDRRQKEEAELVAARRRYDELIEEQRYLQKALLEQEKQMMAARRAEQNWHEGLLARKEWILDNDSETAHNYRKLEQALQQTRSQITEIEEAAAVVRRSDATADAMLDRLNSAEGWSTFDVWSRGGIISHVAKYNHLDAVSELTGQLKAQLRDLRSELADIRMEASFDLNAYSNGTRALDFFFDNIFTDLSVRDRVREDLDSVHQIKGKLHQIEKELSRRLAQAKGQANQDSAKMQQLLLTSSQSGLQ